MIRIDRVVTRGGDAGQTSLGDGSRVTKDDMRVEAYGTVDEANATIGLLRLHVGPDADAMLGRIQNDLFDIGADLCVPGEAGDRLRLTDTPSMRLEAEVAAMNGGLAPLGSFILPGGTPAAAHAHLARTIVRRAERRVVLLHRHQPVNPAVIRYLNRLSDHLFVLGRTLNPGGDVLWTPGGEPVTRAAQVADPAAEDTRPEDEAEDMPLPHDWQTIFLGGLFVLACLVLANLAQEVILPVVIAIVLKLLLQPLVRLLERIKLPKALGALVAVLVLLAVFAVLGAVLSGPASEMVKNFPGLMQKAQERFSSLQDLVARARPLLERVGLADTNPMDMVHLNPGGLAGSVASGASGFASHLLEILLILYYMLVFGETFMRRLVEVLPRFAEKKQAVEISDAVERDISAYLLTITIINACVGVLAGLAMWLFGVPGALVWGVLAFAFNYVPIIGPVAGVLLFAVVGLATLGTTWFALAPAAIYLALHFAEGEVITPMLLAKRFTLNPIAVMLSLVFWFWMWGVQGAILSVPLLAITKIVSDRIRPMRALGHLLEG